MEDQSNQRVQAHAAAALINFTEDCPKSLLIPYLDNLVKHLHSIMVLKLQEVRTKSYTWLSFERITWSSLLVFKGALRVFCWECQRESQCLPTYVFALLPLVGAGKSAGEMRVIGVGAEQGCEPR